MLFYGHGWDRRIESGGGLVAWLDLAVRMLLVMAIIDIPQS